MNPSIEKIKNRESNRSPGINRRTKDEKGESDIR